MGIDWHTLIFDWDTPINASGSCIILTACFDYLYRECANKKEECANHLPLNIAITGMILRGPIYH
jgi:hypothetical protein